MEEGGYAHETAWKEVRHHSCGTSSQPCAWASKAPSPPPPPSKAAWAGSGSWSVVEFGDVELVLASASVPVLVLALVETEWTSDSIVLNKGCGNAKRNSK